MDTFSAIDYFGTLHVYERARFRGILCFYLFYEAIMDTLLAPSPKLIGRDDGV